MEPEHKTTEHVLLSGANYLDSVVIDLVKQEERMKSHAAATQIEQVKEGYIKFAVVLHHCADTLRAKSVELRGGNKGKDL